MPAYRVPLLLWFFMATAIAILPAAFFAYPIGIGVYAAVFILGGGPAGQASALSKMFAEALCMPAGLFSLLFPNPGGNLLHALLMVGFPYGWLLFTIIFSLLGFSRWNRNVAKEQSNELTDDNTPGPQAPARN